MGDPVNITPLQADILKALKDLEHAVATLRTATPKPDLGTLFARIDELAERLPGDTDPQLLHFLRKRSYEKARLWLEERRDEIARGGCQND